VKGRLKILLFFLTFFGAAAFSSADEPGPVGENKFWITYYYVVNSKSYPDTHDVDIKDVLGRSIPTQKVNEQFRKDMDIEGTGWLRDGRTVNYAKVIDGEIRYKVVDHKYGEGIGRCPLDPFHTIAVDPSKIPFGAKVKIKEFEGVEYVNENGKKARHDGLFMAYDRGGMIKENHIDIFAGVGKESTEQFENQNGLRTRSVVTIEKVADPDPNGCQSREANLTGGYLQKAGVASHLEALLALYDEYSERKAAKAVSYLSQKIEIVRAEWESGGKIKARPDYLKVWMEIERDRIEKALQDRSVSLIPRFRDTPLVESQYFETGSGGKTAPRIAEYNGDGDEDRSGLQKGEVILTFDDGPHPVVTPQVVEILTQYRVSAAFFEIGENVAAHPELTRLVASSGFPIGNHTYTHPDLRKFKADEVVSEVRRGEAKIQGALGGANAFLLDYYLPFFKNVFSFERRVWAPEIFRAPYGARNRKILQTLANESKFKIGLEILPSGDELKVHFTHFMWNVDSLDWTKGSTPEDIVRRVFSGLRAQGQGILLFHDRIQATADALKIIIPRLEKEGYKVVSVYDLLRRVKDRQIQRSPVQTLAEM